MQVFFGHPIIVGTIYLSCFLIYLSMQFLDLKFQNWIHYIKCCVGARLEGEGGRRGDAHSQLAAFSIQDETRYAGSALSFVLKTSMYVFLTIHNCYHLGLYPTWQTHINQTFIFEKVGIQCFCLFRVTDIHMWQKDLGRFWWTIGDRIEGVKSAIGTQDLNFKSFWLQPF